MDNVGEIVELIFRDGSTCVGYLVAESDGRLSIARRCTNSRLSDIEGYEPESVAEVKVY